MNINVQITLSKVNKINSKNAIKHLTYVVTLGPFIAGCLQARLSTSLIEWLQCVVHQIKKENLSKNTAAHCSLNDEWW